MEDFKLGVEVHVRLGTVRKLFSSALNKDSLSRRNTYVNTYDCAIPGAKPRLNVECYLKALIASIILGCVPSKFITFDRKHYLYLDLPHGYQLTQRYHPVSTRGCFQGIKIKQIHLEMDAAKTNRYANGWEVDYNRAGAPLIEIVTQPDITSFTQLSEFLTSIRERLVKYGVSNCNMYRGDMRFDLNVSGCNNVRQEIKNLNSFKSAVKAVEFLINHDLLRLRHSYTWEWSNDKSQLIKLRDKLEYFYLPEFDVPKFMLSKNLCIKVSSYLKERARIINLVEREIKDDWLREIVYQFPWDNFKSMKYFKNLVNLMQGKRVRKLNQDEAQELLSFNHILNFNQVRDYLLKGKTLRGKSFKDVSSLSEELSNFERDVKDMLDGNVKARQYLIGQMVKLGYDPKEVNDMLIKMLNDEGWEG